MVVNGFIRDVRSVGNERLRRWYDQGKLGAVYVQVEHNIAETIDANLKAFSTLKMLLPGRVYAWMWGTISPAADAGRVEQWQHRLDPAGFCFNDENETKGHDRSIVYEAAAGKPFVVSTTGLPSISPVCYRVITEYGGKIEFQCYGPAGDNRQDGQGSAHDHVVDAITPPKLIVTAEGSPAWWYRVFFDNLVGPKGSTLRRWGWAQATKWDPARGVLRLKEGRNLWAVKAHATSFGHVLEPERTVFNFRTGRHVGRVYGVTRYPLVGVSLSTERPVSALELRAMASAARVPGAAPRQVALYTLDNTTDEQFDAVASVA